MFAHLYAFLRNPSVAERALEVRLEAWIDPARGHTCDVVSKRLAGRPVERNSSKRNWMEELNE